MNFLSCGRKIKTNFLNTRFKRIFSFFLIFALVITSVFFFFSNKQAEASWWDDMWDYRKSVDITNNTNEEDSVYVSLTLDTSDSSKFQGDCGDLRFIKSRENSILPYYIVSGCGTNSTVIHINFDVFKAGSQTVYYYYGNPSASNGFEASDFSTEASNYSIGELSQEQESPGNPIGYWSLNEGVGSTAYDESGQENDGTIYGATWKSESECVAERCLDFDGINDYIGITNTVNRVKTINFWIKTTSSSTSFINLNASAYISSINGAVNTSGFSSSTVYVNAVESSILSSNEWQMITVVTDTAIDASDLSIGNISGNYFTGSIDEIKIYPYVRTVDQIQQDYSAGVSGISSPKGTGISFGGTNDIWVTDGLVAHWKFDEGYGGTAHDSSGNANHGTLSAGGGGTATFTAKSVILDIADNWGGTLVGLRSVDFWYDGTKISLAATDFTAYATSEASSSVIAAYAFDTSLSKTGVAGSTQWYSTVSSNTNQRLIVVFDSSQTFDGIRINNSHHEGTATDRGAKNVVIHYSTDSITSTTYNASISNSTKIFDGQFDEHVALDVEDEQTLTLSGGASVAGGTNTTTSAMWDKGGKFGGACKFDGTDDSVAISNFQFSTSNQFSISKWINVQTLATAKPIVSQWGGSQNNILIKTDDVNSDELRICVASSLTDACTNYAYTTDADLSVSSWKHLNIVYDGSQSTNATKLKLFVNGVQKTLSFSGTIPATIQTTSTSALEIGGNSILSAYLSAILDEVKIYNYALTAEQVKTEYNGGYATTFGGVGAVADNNGATATGDSAKYCVPGDTVKCDPPILELAMDEKEGDVAYDTSGNGNDGTITGATWARGKIGSGLEFDGSNDYVDIGDISNNLKTISFWLKSNSLTEDILDLNGGTNTITVSAGTVSANNFVSPTIYVNSLVSSGINQQIWQYITITTDTNIDVNNFDIGRISSSYYDGIMDDIKIYNYTRTPAQIAWEYNRGKPMAEWRFNEGTGTTLHDETDGGNDGTLTNMDSATDWVDGKYGKALDFDGVDDYISVGDTNLNTHSVSFWAKQDYTDNYFLDLDGGTHTVTLSGGTVTATGFTSPTIYIDGINTTTLPDNAWHHITITTTTAIDTNNLNIGKVGTNYYQGSIDNLKLFSYPLTASQVKTDHNNGVAVNFSDNDYQATGSALASSWTCGDNLTDDRDSEVYATIEIGDQCWFAEDLRYECANYYPTASTWTGTECADQGTGYDGLLYQWDAAMDGSEEEGAQGLCPVGWHIPTDEELKMLEGAVDSTYGYPDAEWDISGAYRGDDAGDQLKDPDEEWCGGRTPCGQSGWNALPGGFRLTDGTLFLVGSSGHWWSSSVDGGNAWYRYLHSNNSGVYRSSFSQAYGFSVRCLRD